MSFEVGNTNEQEPRELRILRRMQLEAWAFTLGGTVVVRTVINVLTAQRHWFRKLSPRAGNCGRLREGVPVLAGHRKSELGASRVLFRGTSGPASPFIGCIRPVCALFIQSVARKRTFADHPSHFSDGLLEHLRDLHPGRVGRLRCHPSFSPLLCGRPLTNAGCGVISAAGG